MKELIVKTQEEMDAVALDFDGVIKVLGARITIEARYRYRVVAWGNASVVARENASVVAWENASVVARGNASVEARGNASVVAWENASVVAWGNASVVARENASVVAWENASVVARGNASVVARENASVVAWENASVVARGNASVVARENACIRISAAIKSLSMFGFSILFKPFDLKFKFKKSATAHVQEVRPLPFLERDGVSKDHGSVVLFKRVSADWKTQKGTPRETVWTPGTKVTHPAWDPTSGECGVGKFHACSRPYFCDQFRSEQGDRYIAIRIKVAELYEWPNPKFPHKIAFREGKVLYECDRMGKRVEP